MNQPSADKSRAAESAQMGAHLLGDAESMLEQAERDPKAARAAAVAALRALLRLWSQTPRGESVSELLAQAAETDETLAEFMPDAEVLDANDPIDGTYERAKVFVDAARGRVVNI